MSKATKRKPAKKAAKSKKPAAPKKTGRPSKFSQALVDDICKRLTAGEPLAAICRDEGMPDPSTFWDWSQARPELSQAIARAREAGFHAIAADALAIADDGRRDYVPTDDGREVVDHDHIARSRLRVETRLKLLSKWAPKLYGDRVTLAGDPEAPLQTESTVTVEPGEAYMRLLNPNA